VFAADVTRRPFVALGNAAETCVSAPKHRTGNNHKMKNRADINDFNSIPNVGPATIQYLSILGIKKPFALIGQKPYSMYKELSEITGKHFDPCLADVFISAVKFMEGAPPKKWWNYTKERKEHYRMIGNS